MTTIPDGPAYTIGEDFHLGKRYDIADMARDCGCLACQVLLAKRDDITFHYHEIVTTIEPDYLPHFPR